MANIFPHLYDKKKATFQGIMVLLPGAATIPSNNSRATRFLADKGLHRLAPFTLKGEGPEDYQQPLLQQLPVLQRLHSAGVSYNFVRRGDSGNAIDEEQASRFDRDTFPPTLGQLTRACNRPNVSKNYVHLRLREPFNHSLLDAPAAETSAGDHPVPTTTTTTTIPTNEHAATATTIPSSSTPPPATAAALPFEEEAYQDYWDPFTDALMASPVHEPIDLTAEDLSADNAFDLKKYIRECFPQCRGASRTDIHASMEPPYMPDVLKELGGMSITDVHAPLNVHLYSAGGGASLASDVGGVTRHYFYRAFREVVGCTMGDLNKQAFAVGDNGLWFPSAHLHTLTRTPFWVQFGEVLYLAFVNGCWFEALHPAVVKYLLGYKIAATDLRGYSASFDQLLAEDADPAAVDASLVELNVCAGDLRVPEGCSGLLHKQHLLAGAVLRDRPLPALMAIKEGFTKRAHADLLSGGTTFAPLDLTYFSRFTCFARTAEDIITHTSDNVDRTCPVYLVWEAALRRLNSPDEITALMAWCCGCPSLPPKEPIQLRMLREPSEQGNFPTAHVCHYTVDLSSKKYVPPLCPTFEAGVVRLLSDLRFCLQNTGELSIA